MEVEWMIEPMFEQALTDAEVKAIAKARGFPSKAVTRSAVKNLFTTDLGLEANFSSLTNSELAALHMLSVLEVPVDITFFERLYHDPTFNFHTVYMLTFSQRYREVLKDVRDKLVRKGVLLMAPDAYAGGIKLEQWRFAIPDSFAAKLPPLLTPQKLPGAPGLEDLNENKARKKILELVGEPQENPLAKDPSAKLSLKEGSLWWGKELFSQHHLFNWQINCWSRSFPVKLLSSSEVLHPVQAILHAIQSFSAEDWITGEQVEPLLQIYSFGLEIPDGATILEQGWQWGMLQRRNFGDKAYYSPRFYQSPEGMRVIPLPQPETYIKANNKHAEIDLSTAPPLVIPTLNMIGDLRLDGSCLSVTPSLAKITKIFHLIDSSLIYSWLGKNVKAFQTAFSQVKERWGKTLLHTNLLVARVTDPGILAQMERAFEAGVDYVRLNKEYIAFREEIVYDVEKIVTKSDHIIKWVRPK